MNKILVTPQGFTFVKDSIKSHFVDSNEYLFTDGLVSDREKLIELLKPVNVAILGSEKIDAGTLETCKNLKAIVRFGSGLDNIDLAAAEAKGVAVYPIYAKTVTKSVATLAFTLLMSSLYRVIQHDRDAKQNKWLRYVNQNPEDMTVGIFGAGKIGFEFAKLLRPLGFKLAYFSRRNNPDFEKLSATRCESLVDLILQSSVISLHIPSNENTRNIISSGMLTLMKGKILINTSRGALVDEAALMGSLDSGGLSMYLTDVVCSEPPTGISEKLRAHERVVATAHIGGYSSQCLIEVATAALAIAHTELRG